MQAWIRKEQLSKESGQVFGLIPLKRAEKQSWSLVITDCWVYLWRGKPQAAVDGTLCSQVFETQLQQHGTDGAMQMRPSLSRSLSVYPVFLFPVSRSPGIQVHGDTARGGVPCGSRLPCSDGNTLPVTEQRRTGGKRDGDRRKEREKGCRGRAEE
ncbi:hypothetical protein QQF64_023071 [Cirrhinus molitorella]|uniref:Gelsolin-like domain-containing protein n=1 Tax=Cirrhinus molitorella TaxID=172907 RepID=A0ABR3L5V6_9TELE